jgi:hypothetical protein
MLGSKSFLSDKLSNFIENAWLNLPAEAAKALTGLGDESGLNKAAWKAYDAWVSLANEFTNALYSDPVLGEISGRMIETALRLRQLAGVTAAAFYGYFWPLIGLPTHKELVALREDLLALREELGSFAHSLKAQEPAAAAAPPDAVATWKRLQTNGYRRSNGNAIRPPSHQGERNVAAQ